MKRQVKRSPLWTMMTDVGLTLVMVLFIFVNNYKTAWVQAAKVAAEVPGLHEENKGLQGQLEDAEDDLRNYALDGEQKQGTIDTLTKQVGELGEQLGQKTAELNQLRPLGPVDILILPDCTGSMEKHHERLKKALVSLFAWTPRLSSDCRIGCLGFRDGVVYRYPLRKIEPKFKDSGQSRSELLKFMASMQVSGAPTNHLPVFEEALTLLPDANRKGRKQVIIILGDVGPSELDGQIGFNQMELGQAKQIVSKVQTWASKGNRSVGSIFVGNDDPASFDRMWFESLAQPAGQNFATDSAELFNVIFRSIEN